MFESNGIVFTIQSVKLSSHSKVNFRMKIPFHLLLSLGLTLLLFILYISIGVY